MRRDLDLNSPVKTGELEAGRSGVCSLRLGRRSW